MKILLTIQQSSTKSQECHQFQHLIDKLKTSSIEQNSMKWKQMRSECNAQQYATFILRILGEREQVKVEQKLIKDKDIEGPGDSNIFYEVSTMEDGSKKISIFKRKSNQEQLSDQSSPATDIAKDIARKVKQLAPVKFYAVRKIDMVAELIQINPLINAFILENILKEIWSVTDTIQLVVNGRTLSKQDILYPHLTNKCIIYCLNSHSSEKQKDCLKIMLKEPMNSKIVEVNLTDAHERVFQLKKKASMHFELEENQIQLTFAGQLLKNNEEILTKYPLICAGHVLVIDRKKWIRMKETIEGNLVKNNLLENKLTLENIEKEAQFQSDQRNSSGKDDLGYFDDLSEGSQSPRKIVKSFGNKLKKTTSFINFEAAMNEQMQQAEKGQVTNEKVIPSMIKSVGAHSPAHMSFQQSSEIQPNQKNEEKQIIIAPEDVSEDISMNSYRQQNDIIESYVEDSQRSDNLKVRKKAVGEQQI